MLLTIAERNFISGLIAVIVLFWFMWAFYDWTQGESPINLLWCVAAMVAIWLLYV